MAKGRRLTQSQSVQGFRPFTIERRQEDDLPDHIKGAAIFREIEDKEGYWVYNLLSAHYLTIEYSDETHQWYFIKQDTRSNKWMATRPVPPFIT